MKHLIEVIALVIVYTCNDTRIMLQYTFKTHKLTEKWFIFGKSGGIVGSTIIKNDKQSNKKFYVIKIMMPY